MTRGARRPLLGALIAALALALPAIAAERVSPGELLSASDRWHGLPVIVEGTVTRLERRVSARGNPYVTFRLADGPSSVTVFSYGTPDVKEGARVQVEGFFLKVKRVGTHTFQNQLDAIAIRPL